jgi:UPF0176 protein
VETLRRWSITSFYKFLPLDAQGLEEERLRWLAYMQERHLVGLLVLAPEGINGTLAGSGDAIDELKQAIERFAGEVRFKDSTADVQPFKRPSVDVREEIVGLKQPDLVPETQEDHHLSPAEWHAWMESEEPKLIIDTRNAYETAAGKFKGAIDPGLEHFSHWPDYVRNADLPKDVPVLMYCTGGIRCEKAILEMRRQGFEKVYQLRDGILGYLAEFPNAHYEGECFVFDDRVTVGQDLEPTGNFGICPGCGLTSNEKRQCAFCGQACFNCPDCLEKMLGTCSKRCRDSENHRQRRSKAS